MEKVFSTEVRFLHCPCKLCVLLMHVGWGVVCSIQSLKVLTATFAADKTKDLIAFKHVTGLLLQNSVYYVKTVTEKGVLCYMLQTHCYRAVSTV